MKFIDMVRILWYPSEQQLPNCLTVKKRYIWTPIILTLAYSKLELTGTKIDLPWISIIQLMQFFPWKFEPSITRTSHKLETIFVSLQLILYIILPSLTGTATSFALKTAKFEVPRRILHLSYFFASFYVTLWFLSNLVFHFNRLLYNSIWFQMYASWIEKQ